jgi:uncharacterized protein
MRQGFLYSAFLRILMGLAACVVGTTLVQYGIKAVLSHMGPGRETASLAGGVLIAAVAVTVYCFLYRAYEQRSITEFSPRGLGKNLGLGILLGALLQALTIAVIWVSGGFSILGVNSPAAVIPALTMALTSAVFEETLFRGIIFRIIEEKGGSVLALIISAFIFGIVHLMNPNSSLLAALGLAIQAGFLLGAAYIFTRNLWFPIALHFAWNFTQSGIFGASTSGNAPTQSLLVTQIEGPAVISGGAFGPEGSLQATCFCLIAAIILVVLSARRKTLI